MKSKLSVLCGIILSVFILLNCKNNTSLLSIKGPYLGETPPGVVPKVFAPEFVKMFSNDSVEVGCFEFNETADVAVIRYFYHGDPYRVHIYTTEMKKNGWTLPVKAPFNSEKNDWDYNFAPDGKTLFFTSNRLHFIDGKKSEWSHIWKTTLTNSKWSEPQLMNSPINILETYSGYGSMTENGGFYFHSRRQEDTTSTSIYYLKKGSDEVKNIKELNNPNTREFDPVIAHDGSYIIYISGGPPYHLNISFKTEDDSWTEPQIILNGWDAGLPTISSDGKYLFFAANASVKYEIHWVSIKYLEQFRPTNN